MIQIANYSAGPVRGWVSTTTDQWDDTQGALLHPRGLIVPGRLLPGGLRMLHVHTKMKSGEVLELLLSDAKPTDPVKSSPQINADWVRRLGVPTVNGVEIPFRDAVDDGPAVRLHFSGYVTRMLRVDLWVTAYHDKWSMCGGTMMVTCSNPAIPDITHLVERDITLVWGEATISIAGHPQANVYPHGDTVADGQARVVPVQLIWPTMMQGLDWSTSAALAYGQFRASAVKDLYVTGGFPLWQNRGQDKVAWINTYFPECQRALLTWDRPRVGVAKRSNDAGEQEDQLFPGGEAAGVPGGILTRLYAAMGQAKRPSHHLEANGAPLDYTAHPDLTIWDGRAHGSDRDKLGKVASLNDRLTNGWWGPDNEHFLMGSLFVAYRLTGDPGIQRLLHHHGINWLFMNTVQRNKATSHFFASRAVGYEFLAAWFLWHSLEDRALAQRIYDRVPERIDMYLRHIAEKGDIWDLRLDDPRLGTGYWWMPWQQALGAWGLDLGSRLVGHAGGMAAAKDAAMRVIHDALFRTVSWTITQQMQGEPPTTTTQYSDWSAWYALSTDGRTTAGQSDWMDFAIPLALATALANGVKTDQVIEVWNQMQRNGTGKWFPPMAPYQQGEVR